ncbi:MAG: ABC transporter permease [Halobacteriaceae archaeon]
MVETDRGQLTRIGRRGRTWLERHALAVTGVLTAVLLTVFFYYPVLTVLVEAVVTPAGVTVHRFVLVVTSEFYFGWIATLLTAPATALDSAAAWLAALVTGPFDALPSITPGTMGLFVFTAAQALLSTVASVVLGVPAAYILARYEFRGRETVRSLTALPFVMPSIVVAIGFVATFGRTGVLNQALVAVGLDRLGLMYSLEIIILAHAFYNAPLVARVTTAAWESVDASLQETARSLGATPRRAFRDVVVPQLLPAVLTGALLTFVFTFLTFPIVLTLGGFQLSTVEVWVYHEVQQLDYGEAATLAVLETVVSLGLTYAYLRYEAAQRRVQRAVRPLARRRIWSAPPLVRAGIVGYAVVAAVVFVVPMGSMIIASLTNATGPTLAHYAFLVHRQAEAFAFQVKPFTAVLNSVLFAIGALALAVPMGVAVAVLSTRGGRGRRLLEAVAMAPFAVSGIVVGLGLLRGLVFGITVAGHRLQVTGAVAIVAAHAVAAYPFVTRNVSPMLARIDPQVVESARSLGASRVRALLDVELPLVVSGVVAGAAFAFAISMGEFDATVVLATGGDYYTMPVAIERYTGRQLGPATAMGTILLGVTAISFLVIDRFGGVFDRG